jgi:Protein of unknown function (DUF3341)
MKDFVLAEFRDEIALCAAARRLRELGHTDLDAHSPVPLHGVDEALGLRRSVVPLIALVGGIVGGLTGYAMQVWMNAVDYPINVANRPFHSPPANVPITFEMTVLISVLAIVFGLFALCGFPRTHHPAFDVEAFRTHSIDALWLSARVDAGRAETVVVELERLGAAQVSRVPEEERR